jgi:hypothetical protein
MDAALILVVVVMIGCVALLWLLRRPDLPFRPRSYYDRRGFGRLTNPEDPEPAELTEAVALLRAARRKLHDTLVVHHTSGAYPPILYESSSPLFVSSNSPHLYVFTESLEDRDSYPYWTKTLRTTPACTWTVQVGVNQMGRSQEERISLTIDAQSRPRLHASNHLHRYPGTSVGWSELIQELAALRDRRV